ncbi:MAG: CAP domain-containing protein, partial [Gammaproteobacteria bacterium]
MSPVGSSALRNPALYYLLTALIWLCSVFLSETAVGSPPLIDSRELERSICSAINRERQKHDLAPLARNAQIVAIARSHSRDMAIRHFFSHMNLQGETPTDRGLRQGWREQKRVGPETLHFGLAENIYLASLYDRIYTTRVNGRPVKKEYLWKNINQLTRTIVQGWMNSPPHRKIILSPRYNQQGIGVFISADEAYVTQNLFTCSQ